MNAVVIILFLGIVVLLWRSNSRFSKLTEVIEAQNTMTNKEWGPSLSNQRTESGLPRSRRFTRVD